MKASTFLAGLGRATVLMLVTAFVLGPMLVTFLGGFKSAGKLRTNPFGLPDVWQTEYFTAILNDAAFWRYLGNSLFISMMAVFLTLIVAGAAAYVFAQIRFFGAKSLQAYLFLGLVFPFATAILPLFIKVRDLGLLDSYWAVILPQTAFGLSLAILLFNCPRNCSRPPLSRAVAISASSGNSPCHFPRRSLPPLAPLFSSPAGTISCCPWWW
jgi:raffinose/stachyose/melibiose transport system permease protein